MVGTKLLFRSERNLTSQIVADQVACSTTQNKNITDSSFSPASFHLRHLTMSAIVDSKKPVVGIFAIQGAVEEHADLVKKCGGEVKEVNIMTSLTKSLRRN